MKRIKYLFYCGLAFAFLSCNSSLEKKDLPEEVIKSFETAFPEVGNEKWSSKGEDYEVTFKEGSEEVIYRFKSDGAFLKVDRDAEDEEDIETIIHTTPLP